MNRNLKRKFNQDNDNDEESVFRTDIFNKKNKSNPIVKGNNLIPKLSIKNNLLFNDLNFKFKTDNLIYDLKKQLENKINQEVDKRLKLEINNINNDIENKINQEVDKRVKIEIKKINNTLETKINQQLDEIINKKLDKIINQDVKNYNLDMLSQTFDKINIESNHQMSYVN
tara:strand:+ start:9202 stop:9714 length:513 start_codon:yes stop_codon:yes gene_type:complete